jgi:hypothetical protein
MRESWMREPTETAEGRRWLAQPLWGVLAFLAVAMLPAIALAFSLLFFGSGGAPSAMSPLCVNESLSAVAGQVQFPAGGLVSGLKPGGTSGVGGLVSVCAAHPTAEQRALMVLTIAPNRVFYLVILAVVAWLLATVRRSGPFVPRVAGLLRFLGWYVLIGYVVVLITQGLAALYFLASATTIPVPIAGDLMSGGTGPVLLGPVVAACALLTLARIMRLGSSMRDDLAGTV